MAKVLVVDDEGLMRLNLRRMLKKLGHEVVAEAASGLDAVKMYKRHKPELVTMDITMPFQTSIQDVEEIKDGIDAVRRITLEFPDAKVIMVTSRGEQEKVIGAIQKGATNYILKPIDIEKLEEVLEKVL